MAVNPLGKTRPAKNPYLTIENNGWRWHVLRAYSLNPDAQAARWFCAVESPFLSPGEMEYGDTYIAEIKGLITHRDPVVPDEVLPRHLRGW